MITVRWPRTDAAFPQVEFRRLFRQIRRQAADDAAMVTAYTDGVVTLRSKRRLDGYHEAADMSGMQGVRVGDFVVHGLDILRGSVGVSDADGAISSVCVICAPVADVEPRYFAWQIRAQAASGLPRALARGVREGGADFRRWDTLAELPVLCPPPGVQKAIADYLDTETARIDALIARKQRMIELFESRRVAAIWEQLVSAAPHSIRVKSLVTKIGSGSTPRGGADVYVDEGVAFLRSQNVRDGRVIPDDVVFITEDEDAAMSGTRVRDGDVLLNITGGSIGRTAVVVDSDLPANVSQHVCIVRPAQGVDSRVLQAALETKSVRDQISLLQVGGNREGLNFEQVRNLEVHVPLRNCHDLVDGIDFVNTRHRRAKLVLRRQIELLSERRQALITAAVTGELEVPGVAA